MSMCFQQQPIFVFYNLIISFIYSCSLSALRRLIENNSEILLRKILNNLCFCKTHKKYESRTQKQLLLQSIFVMLFFSIKMKCTGDCFRITRTILKYFHILISVDNLHWRQGVFYLPCNFPPNKQERGLSFLAKVSS